MSTAPLTLAELRAARAARLAAEREHLAALRQKEKEKAEEFHARLETYKLTDDDKERIKGRLRDAFERHEPGTPPEFQLFTFPSQFCSDQGRRVVNHLEGWRDTLPAVVREYLDWFDATLRPGGFHTFLRVIDYPDGMPGNLGIFISWKSEDE